MKSLVDVLVHILQDCSMMCGANPIRDTLCITRRTKNEGDSFLTITLPSYCQGFERCLESGVLSPALFPKFRFRRGTCCPRFLGGYMERIFDSRGVLREDASSDCIFAIRQICLFAKKLKSPCTARRQKAAEAAYLHCESELRSHESDDSLSDVFSRVSRVIWTSLSCSAPFGDVAGLANPRHGPGTTSERLRGNAKFRFPSWPLRLEAEFPYTEFGIGSISNFGIDPQLSSIPQPSARDETPVRVIFVPKTQKTPRVIAAEPVCMQYIQQSVAAWLKDAIEHRCPYTAGSVNFSDQTVNARCALLSSQSGTSATIDMSEASDRVSSKLVSRMLESVPKFRRQVFACRSTRALLPSGTVIPLRKFASMGSALCFPIESMAFYIAIISIRISIAGVRTTPSTIRKYSTGVYVYGDDLIVPVDVAPLICENLKAFGFKVNAHKSFWNGKFRESCGMDAYNGHDVTPTYVRYPLPVDKTDPKRLASAVSLANQFYLAGLWGTARAIRKVVDSILGPLDAILTSENRLLERVINGLSGSSRGSAGLGWISFSNGESSHGWSHRYQRLRSKRWMVSPARRRDLLLGDAALLKCLLKIGQPDHDEKHLVESVRFGNLALKRRWTV